MKRKNETRQGKGFTLVELLVVVAIIALLVSILLPTLSRAKELTKRTICGTNMHAIGRSFYLYANDYNGFLPSFVDKTDCNTHLVGRFATLELKDAANTYSSGSSRGYYQLVTVGMAQWASFQCPSDGIALKNERNDTLYDFDGSNAHSHALSFSLHVTKRNPDGDGIATRDTDNANKAMVADFNGLLTRTHASTCDGYWRHIRDGNITLEDDTAINSPNHGRDGQNVLFLGGNVTWPSSTLVGVDNDCIWTKDNDTEMGDGTLPSKCFPTDENDSLLR